MSQRIRREDAIAVASAIPYDPSCDGCCGLAKPDGNPEPHRDDCAMKAARRILEAV